MHKSRKRQMGLGLGDGYQKNKTIVMGVLDRDARQVRATVIPFARRPEMEAMRTNHVEPGTMMTLMHMLVMTISRTTFRMK